MPHARPNRHHPIALGVKHKTRAAIRMGALTGLAALALAACGSSTPAANSPTGSGGSTGPTIPPPAKVTGTLSGPGVTAKTITIGQITTISGPVPGLFQDSNDGLDAYVAYLNANGGIDGRTVKILRADDQFNCNVYTQELKTMSTEVFAMVGTFTLNDGCGTATLKADPNLVDVQGTVLTPALYSLPNVFTPTPDPAGYATTGYQGIKDKFPTAITKAATLIPGAALANGKEQELTAESIGYKFVYSRVIGPIETNFTADILRMKSDGVKIVDLGAVTANDVADFIEPANQQGLHLDAVISAAAYDGHLLKLLGNPSIANNLLYSPLSYSLYLGTDRTTVPAVNTFLTWLNKTHPNKSASIFSVSSWGAGTLLTQAMAAAGPNVTQAAVIRALDNITTFDSSGLTADTNPAKRLGATCDVIAGIQNGQWTRIDPKSGFECDGVYHNVPLSALGS